MSWDDLEGQGRKLAAFDARLTALEKKVDALAPGGGGESSGEIADIVHDLASHIAALRKNRPALFEPRKEPEENPTS